MEVDGKIYNINHPHIRIDYRGIIAKLSLDLSMMQGRLPIEVKIYVIDWAFKNKRGLMEKWKILTSLRKNRAA